jgi:hypothetical protein
MDLSRSDQELRRTYARALDIAAKAAFAFTLVAFSLYLTGVLPALVPLAELPRYWGLPVDGYLAATGVPREFEWRLAGHGDVLNLAAMALLALVTPACYARLVPALLAQRDWLLALLALAQLAILLAAASGLLAG